MAPRTKVSSQFQASSKARDWGAAPEDLSSVFIKENPPEALASSPNQPPSAAGLSPQTSSDSGERSACLLDFKAVAFLLLFTAALTHK